MLLGRIEAFGFLGKRNLRATRLFGLTSRLQSRQLQIPVSARSKTTLSHVW